MEESFCSHSQIPALGSKTNFNCQNPRTPQIKIPTSPLTVIKNSSSSLMEGCLDPPPWVDLPDPLTELILEHLPLPDYIRFAALCRKWGSIQKDHRLRHSPHPPPMGAHLLPWLIPRDLRPGSEFECYSPLEKKLHRLRYPTTFPDNPFCIASSRGWLLMHPCDDNPALPFPKRPFLFNPLTGAVILLPMLSIVPGAKCHGALSSPPYDPDCTVLLLSSGNVFLFRLNDPGDGWTMGLEINEWEWIDSVVYCGGKFYCLSMEGGELYIIDGVCSTPSLLRLTMDVSARHLRDWNRCRLVEFGGELLLVVELYDRNADPEGFQVLRADLSGEKWVEKMGMLGDHVLFLDPECLLSLLASDVGYKKNCIYFTLEHPYLILRGFDLDTKSWIRKATVRYNDFNHKFNWGHWFLPTLA